MPRPFHIVTISNDRAVYDAMRASMAAVGYDEANCRFTLLDNTAGNRHEPYQVIRDSLAAGDEPYLVLCHQDLLFDDRTGRDVLARLVDELNARDRRWALAGPAGGDLHGKLVMHLDDPFGNWRAPGLPRRAQSLDECFLLFRRGRAVPPTPGLSGFHFYGGDAALSAIAAGRTAYIIAFPVRHLSPGNTKSREFLACRAAFVDAWRPRLLVGLVRTTCAELRVSAHPLVERALVSWPRVSRFLFKHGLAIIPEPRPLVRPARPRGGS